MRHISHIDRIAEAIADHRLCLFYIKAPDCGVCNVMLDKVGRMADSDKRLFLMCFLLKKRVNFAKKVVMIQPYQKYFVSFG